MSNTTEKFTWETIRDAQAFARIAPEVDELVARAELEPLASAAWTLAYWEAFGERQRIEVHVLRRDGRLVAVVPLERSGVLPRTLRAAQNEHHPYFVPAIDVDDPAVADVLLERLLAIAERVDLRRLPFETRVGRALARAASRRELRISRHENTADTTIDLSSDWTVIQGRFAKHVRRDARQQRNRLEAMGDVQFRVVTCGDELAPTLDACFALEAAGWKGTEGEPMRARPDTLHFYTRLAALAAERGQLAIYTLELDGRLIAFEYTIRGARRIECLKIGYDESLARHSPGTVLRMWLLEREARAGQASSYHLGRPSEWKRRWTSELPPVGTLCIYAPTMRGRIAHLAGPVLRSYAKHLVARTRPRGTRVPVAAAR